MTWMQPRLRSNDVLVNDGGVVSLFFQKWLDRLCSRVDNKPRRITASETIKDDDYFLVVDATTAPVTLTLPPAKGNTGREISVKKVDFTGNAMTLAADGTDLIDWAATKATTTSLTCITVICDGTYWWVKT